MYHVIYKTTNLVNGMFYIGYHGTNDLNDHYLGSGKYFKRAIKKYGRNSFKKEILYIFPSKEEALLKESEIVNDDFVRRDDTYNFKVGGIGGCHHVKRLFAENEDFRIKFSNTMSKAALKYDFVKSFKTVPPGMLGKRHTSESIKKMQNSKGWTTEAIQNRISLIKESNIDFSKFGWVQKVSVLINITPQKVGSWMKIHMPDFYQTCYKKNS